MARQRGKNQRRGARHAPKSSVTKRDGMSVRAAAGLPRHAPREPPLVELPEIDPFVVTGKGDDGGMRAIAETSNMKRRPGHEERSLMDDVHAMTFADKSFNGARLSRATIAVQQTIRAQLRQAQKFQLDNDAVRLICHLSHETDRMEHWALLARLPYDCVWFEYDALVKLLEFEAMGTLRHKVNREESINRFGYLLFKDTRGEDRPARWVGHVFGRTPKGSIVPDFIAYVFDPEGDARHPLRGSTYWNSPTLSLRPGFPKMPVVSQHGPKGAPAEVHGHVDPELMLTGLMNMKDGGGTMRDGVWDERKSVEAEQIGPGKYRVLDDAQWLEGPEWLMPRVAAIVDPWWDTHLADRQKTDRDAFHNIMMTSIAENRGHLRWIMTMLASIMGLPRDIRYHAPRTGKRSVGMYQLPYFGSSTIELNIPRENRLIHARKILDDETHETRKRRRHGVLAHWRIVERPKVPTGVFCRHIPALVEGDLAVCERCGMLVRLIHDHERGDISLGYVRHKYEVKG